MLIGDSARAARGGWNLEVPRQGWEWLQFSVTVEKGAKGSYELPWVWGYPGAR